MLADVFENFWNTCLEIYNLDSDHFLSATGLKKTKIKLDLLTNIDMLLTVEKGGICHGIYRYLNAINKYMKNYDRNKGSLYL